ncbi:GMC oxidoreductase-domain-containing protein [Aspergillus insuetus]
MFSLNVTVLLLACSVLAKEFDYIVMDGGTTGLPSLFAWPNTGTRLSSKPEDGSDPETSSPIDWGFVTEPFPGANDRRLHIAQGKCLGGSSALNFMVYHRPTKQSLGWWALTTLGLSYVIENVTPWYQRSVKFTPPNTATRFENASVLYNADAFLPSGGLLEVRYPNYAQSFSTWLEGGFEEVGIHRAVDIYSGKLEEYQYCSSTIRPSDQHRSSSESSYLNQPTPSLTVYTDTLAKRVIFDDELNAVEVEVSHRGFKRNLTAGREIIISAGVFHLPQLLMVSGIGPRQHLEDYGIEVLVDLPGVGQNMWDHPFVGPSYRVNIETVTKLANSATYLASQYLRWARKQLGPFTNPVSDLVTWGKFPYELRKDFSTETLQALSQFPDDWPEVEYISARGFLGNISDLGADQPDDGYQYASIIGVLIAPTSRGTVTLRTADTADLPLVHMNWLDTKSDQEVVVAMFKRIRAVFASDAMDLVVIGYEYFPGNQVQTDEEIMEYIRENVMTLWHPAGTCRMGRIQDLAVVDSCGRFMSTCYMLAEKIAEDIIRNGANVGEDVRADL